MPRFEVLTLFPALFRPFLDEGLLGRAIAAGRVAVTTIDLRPHGLGKHRTVDDDPYGGGPGLVLRPEPLFAAVRACEERARETRRTVRKILLTPQGRPFDQRLAREMAQREEIQLLICGRYEGFDERVRQGLVDDELSGGDYITLGGEVFAMAIIEAVARLVPGVLGNPRSADEESFSRGGLEYPQYTRPEEFEGMRVPEVLTSGDHGAIDRWRKAQARERTRLRRPDLARQKD